MKKVYLLTGQPGTGKTTLIREAVSRLKIKAGGFYTEEIRSGGVREGFRIVTLDGQSAVLAHVSVASPYKVSKYGVDVKSLDQVGVPAIFKAIDECDLVVIDEIGKMELFSSRFKDAVLKAINNGKKVLCTIMLAPNPFADKIKHHPEVRVLTVNKVNWGKVLEEVMGWLEAKT